MAMPSCEVHHCDTRNDNPFTAKGEFDYSEHSSFFLFLFLFLFFANAQNAIFNLNRETWQFKGKKAAEGNDGRQ